MMKPRRGWRKVGLAAILGTTLVGGTACKRQREAQPPEVLPALGAITVNPIPSVEVQGRQLRLDEERLATRVKTSLAEASVFAEPAPKLPTAAVTVEAQPFVQGTADAMEMGVRLRLRIAIRPQGAAPARFAEDVVAIGQAPLLPSEQKNAKEAFERLAERTATDMVLAYVARQKLWSSNSKELDKILQSSDNDLRVEVLGVVGARKLRDLAPSVLRLLSDEDEGVRDAALGAAVALQERGAVRALAQSRQMRDAREMRKILDAIATLGGQEARDYLGFVAETHDDEEIRTMAKASLERLDRRIASPKPTR